MLLECVTTELLKFKEIIAGINKGERKELVGEKNAFYFSFKDCGIVCARKFMRIKGDIFSLRMDGFNLSPLEKTKLAGMYLAKIPGVLKNLYPEFLWHMDRTEKVIYLTFDDGPTPEITDWVLDQLAQYDARATFFVIGKNVAQHPKIVHRAIDAGHGLGNHTQNHRSGWGSSPFLYLRDFLQGQQSIIEFTGYRTFLFRPPYGKITPRQARQVQRSHTVVMMDVMAGDFDEKLAPETCYDNILRHTRPGSIICLHDSQKAWPRMSYALPHLLEHYSQKGYQFKSLNPDPEQWSKVRSGSWR